MSARKSSAKKLLSGSHNKNAGLNDTTAKLASASKSERQSLIKKLPESDEAKIAAAIEIQRVYRGYCARCHLLKNARGTGRPLSLYGGDKQQMNTQKPEKHVKERLMSRGRDVIGARYQQYVQSMTRQGLTKESGDIMSMNDFCAAEIQNWWKNISIRRAQSGKYPSSHYSKESTPQYKQGIRDSPLNAFEAAKIIQRAWRRHIDVQVYSYYRDLINFKHRGDPAMMLRCINPNEAKFLDAAAGIHIKFRLAGDKFPPNIYYKIFTHRPVQDLCANSPKDYTRAETKKLMARDVHNKGNRVPKGDKTSWYQRIENNGWRLVSDRLLQHIMSDPVTWETSYKKMNFHHNKLQRKQDVERKKKLKKIEWMKKMYKNGMLHAKSEDPETIELIEGAAAGMIATVDNQGPDSVQDWEVDELLDWTTSLNFEEYLTGWKEIATSNLSEKAVLDRMKLFSEVSSDPFELRIRHPQDTSTKPSFNTPQSTPSQGSANYNRR